MPIKTNYEETGYLKGVLAERERILALIGSDEPAVWQATLGADGGPSFAGIARNQLRAQLRTEILEGKPNE